MTKWSSQSILVWHLGLLKLLPFLNLRDPRVAVFLHGIEAWRPLSYVTRRLLKRSELLLCNSQYTWDRFIDVNPSLSSKSRVIVHLGLESVAQPVPMSCGTPAAVMIGRMVRSEDYKGHREVIGAWPLVSRRLPKAELWIAGGGDMRNELERVAKQHGGEVHVRFLGCIDESSKEKLVSQCRCLVLPSRNEGFGLVYLEAMRLGRPCLVSTLDAGREVVAPPEAGLAADPDQPEQLASALVRLMTPGQEWDRWSIQARARYEKRFTAAHYQQRLLDALQRISEH